MQTNKILPLIIGGLLIAFGVLRPDFSSVSSPMSVEAPSAELQISCKNVVEILQNSGDMDRANECISLSSLYSDISTLIALDGEDTIIKNTEEIREANRLSGKMLILNLQDKYDNLGEACDAVVKGHIGDDNLVLSSDLRQRSVEVFKALSWAFNQGAK